MKSLFNTELSRRGLLWGAGVVLSSSAAPSHAGPVARWSFRDGNSLAEDATSGLRDSICSRTCQPPLGKGIASGAFRLDGYSTWLTRDASVAPHPTREVTITAWTALESYPTAEAAFVNQRDRDAAGYFFGIDRFGFLHFKVSIDGIWRDCTSHQRVPRYEWTHLAASLHSSGLIALYRDGARIASDEGRAGNIRLASTVDLLVGKADGCDYIGKIFASGVIDGLLDDVAIYAKCLSEDEIQRLPRANSRTTLPDLALPITGDPNRPVYHATPERAWTNEPHGLIHFGGQFHLFYQKNLNGPYWGQINWGHLTSPDLLRWTDRKPALSPEPGLDAAGCWSGSVTPLGDELALIYTAGDGHKPTICLATTRDGRSFAKSAHNPIIPGSPAELNHPDFRDPFVWREATTYYLILGSGIPEVGGTALLYKSTDLVNWTFLHKLLQGDKQDSGVFWEMPVFFPLRDKHVLIVCEVPGRASYWIGDWKDEQFIPDSKAPRRLDIINHFLSPTPYRDAQGRTLAIGIVPDTRSPKEAWKAGWVHCYSIPRVLTLDEHGDLNQNPLPELAHLRATHFNMDKQRVSPEQLSPLSSSRTNALEIHARFSRGAASCTGFRLGRSDDGQEETIVFYDWTKQTVTLDRSRSSLNPDVARTVDRGPFALRANEALEFHILLDHSMLEVFINGRGTLASRIYPTRQDSNGVTFFCDGETDLEGLDIWQINHA